MYKNAITDRSIVPYPDTPPDPGHAGNVIVDPFCGNRLLRVTDDNTKAGSGFTTPSSALNNPWNADGTMLYVKERSGGFWLYDFNSATFQVRQRTQAPSDTRLAYFSRQDPKLLWILTGDLTFESYDVATGKRAILVNFKDYPELGIPEPPERWYLNALSVSYDDQRICAMLGLAQDDSQRIVIWDQCLGVGWLNTQSGDFGGWAEGTIPDFGEFWIHYVGLTPNGSTVYIGPSVQQTGQEQRTVLWVPGTPILTTFFPGPGMPFYGHPSQGFQMHFGRPDGGPFAFTLSPLWNPSLSEPMIKPPVDYPDGFWCSHHMSYQPDPADRNPVIVTTMNDDANPTTPGMPLSAVSPGDNEILALDATGSGTWWRLAHHYSTAQKNFYATPRGNISPDGRFYCFTSDWQLTLGGELPEQRTDVFVLDTTRQAS